MPAIIELYTSTYQPDKSGKGAWTSYLFLPPGGPKRERYVFGTMPEATAEVLALTAIINGLNALKKPGNLVRLCTDQKGVANKIEKGWPWDWQGRGWTKTNGDAVEHSDLWFALLQRIDQQVLVGDDGEPARVVRYPEDSSFRHRLQMAARAAALDVDPHTLKGPDDIEAEGGRISDAQTGYLHMGAQGSGYTEAGLRLLLSHYGAMSAKDVTKQVYAELRGHCDNPDVAKRCNAAAEERLHPEEALSTLPV